VHIVKRYDKHLTGWMGEELVEGQGAQAAIALPHDLEAAHALITDLRHQAHARERQIASKQERIERLEHQLALLRRYVFGRRSEKAAPAVAEQGMLPFAAGAVAPSASDESVPAAVEVRAHQRTAHRGRKALPTDLPVEVVEITPADADLVCSGCEQPKMRIGADTTQALEYRPAAFFIREYVRPKYACPRCQQGVTQAALPARPIEKGRPEPGVLAHVVTSKYADHLPLYRIAQIFARHGITVSRGVLAEWNGAVADLLRPLAQAIQRQLLQSRWIQSDDTTVTVQEAERGYRSGHMWVYRDEWGDQVYDFDWHRNKASPSRILAGYRGYLQVDAAPAYDDIFASQPHIIEVGCWAHARRYFKDAELTAPTEAKQIVLWIRELYGIEKHARESGLSKAQRLERRQQQARPILQRLKARLDELRLQALPKSPLGEAITYALNQWRALERYTEDGALEIDNNGAYAARGISAVMPRPGLCRVGGGQRSELVGPLILGRVEVGIVRGSPGTREGCRWVGSEPARRRRHPRIGGRAPSVACRRGGRSEWSRLIRGQARVRSQPDRPHAAGGSLRSCAAGYAV
jgi:transposase